MEYSIIGSGKIGSVLARHFARNGIPVGVANSRGPDSLAALVEELGDLVKPMTVPEAVRAHTVILAMPFRAHRAIAAAQSEWSGKIVVDAMNTYGIPAEELQGKLSSQIVASAFMGAKVVKTFNQLPAKLLAEDPVVDAGRRVMFLSADDQVAATHISLLVESLGFAPIALGGIKESGPLIGMAGPLLLQNLVKLG